jgi:formylglycine-generating enzyme required for sulfatase activity
VVFVILALAVGFMFLARAVKFEITPLPASLEVTEGVTWQFGERFLMLPGEHRVKASLAGYETLDEPILVTSDADQTFNFELVKLPGILTLVTDPQVSAQVLVDQTIVGKTPLTIDPIAPGLHDVSLVSDRFRTYDTEIEINGKREEQILTVTLQPAWADVTVNSLPVGATILVDGESVGTTPATVEVIEGKREIQLQQGGYKTWQSTIEVTAGEALELAVAKLIRSDGKLSITTTPAGANVTIGGQYRGQTPLAVELKPGTTYPILLSRAGFELVQRNIKVEPDEDIVLDTTLNPVLGVIRLHVDPKDAQLYVDGKAMGAPVSRLELTARNHEIEITKAGYAPFTTTVTPQPGRDQQLMVTLVTEEQARVDAIPENITANNGIELNLILPGDLKMGAGRREPGRRSNEIEKDVTLTRPYYLGIFEVTNAQFKAFAPNHDSGTLGRSLLGEADRPVVNVSWQDAARFCNDLSEQDGLPPAYEFKDGSWRAVTPVTTGYRLPTEAEWAWAARYASGPTPTRFPWGDAMPPETVHANYADVSARSMVPYHIPGYNDAYRGTAPVGSFTANALGIHDLAGNVSEWIHDFYSIALPSGVLTDPTGPDRGEYHVVRGSNYTHGRFSELRWTFRDYGADARADVGFRIARYLE